MKVSAYTESELVIGVVCAAGTDLSLIIRTIRDRLDFFHNKTDVIDVADDILKKFEKYFVEHDDHYINKKGRVYPKYTSFQYDESDRKRGKYEEVHKMMDIGNALRDIDINFIAREIVNIIQSKRNRTQDGDPTPEPKRAIIIKSLKNKAELSLLRDTYRNGFYLLGVYSDSHARENYLVSKNMDKKSALDLIERDEKERPGYGQQTRDIFQLSDFFVNSDENKSVMANLTRIIDLIFGNPFITPTFGEYAMFLAFCTSLRSADLSRQIGAVICKNRDILAMGANDCPQFEGGQYWMDYDETTGKYVDAEKGRDYMRGEDSNRIEFLKISGQIYNGLLEELGTELTGIMEQKGKTEQDIQRLFKSTGLGDIIEFGRVVHAEMEALSMCARNGISTKDTKLYCTTFPCHVCTKHLITAGIVEVVYIEPYPKSKAYELFDDSVSDNVKEKNKKLLFVPFFGVGPRKYIEMFSMNHSWLSDKVRKDPQTGKIKVWKERTAVVRDQMPPDSYLDREIRHSITQQQLSDSIYNITD